MIQIKIFVFNPIEVNTYILYDETGKALIIDPACYSEEENNKLSAFIADNNLDVVLSVNTHTHFDHLLGNNYIFQKFGIKTLMHPKGVIFAQHASNHSQMFGINTNDIIIPDTFLNHGEILKIGNFSLKVLYTPGHVDGSVCFYSEDQGFAVVGDVIFYESIGRTDLPTGSYPLLVQNIREQLLTLDDKTILYPGHGQKTTVAHEKRFNPFLNGSFFE